MCGKTICFFFACARGAFCGRAVITESASVYFLAGHSVEELSFSFARRRAGQEFGARAPCLRKANRSPQKNCNMRYIDVMEFLLLFVKGNDTKSIP